MLAIALSLPPLAPGALFGGLAVVARALVPMTPVSVFVVVVAVTARGVVVMMSVPMLSILVLPPS